jgi:transposase InsO family protein
MTNWEPHDGKPIRDRREVIGGETFAIRADARKEIFAWPNWCNQTRLHSSLDYHSPVEYEHDLSQQSLVA